MARSLKSSQKAKKPHQRARSTTARPAHRRRSLCTPAVVDALVVRLVSVQCFQQLETAIRGCARSLARPATAVLIEGLNRVHEGIAQAIAAEPAAMDVLGEPYAAARSAGFPRWDGDPQASLGEVVAAVREAGRSLPAVH
jgi:hypothetical protein